MRVPCPYCGEYATLQSSDKIYRGTYFGMAYICKNFPVCDSYVGVHKGTTTPLGRLANSELRMWKKKAHNIFDPLWKIKFEREKIKKSKYKKSWARGSAYKWLAKQLGISVEECHIGMFDIDTCKKVVQICSVVMNKINEKRKQKNY
jgi:hypothetical protein